MKSFKNSGFLIVEMTLWCCFIFSQGCEAGKKGETLLENTTRSGKINSDERWRGVIDVTGDITIKSEAVLTIEPGTLVRFAAHSDDQHGGGDVPIVDPYFPNDPPNKPSEMCTIIASGGTLYAVGTADNPITFTSNASAPIAGDWQSLQYEQNGKLVVTYAIIEYAYCGFQINRAATDSQVTINNNTIRTVVGCGICLGVDPNESVTITISGNDISGCGHEGVDTHANATVIIENNRFHDNYNPYQGGAGVVIDSNNSTVRNNQFIDNRFGIAILTESSHPVLEGNVFEGNETDCYGICPEEISQNGQ